MFVREDKERRESLRLEHLYPYRQKHRDIQMWVPNDQKYES